ncbi:hypothetical protein J6590_062294 [Homalodisca vitripennis]|nr:hypothetical protein J6590_062294 [Homalodisca vitripennis]
MTYENSNSTQRFLKTLYIAAVPTVVVSTHELDHRYTRTADMSLVPLYYRSGVAFLASLFLNS